MWLEKTKDNKTDMRIAHILLLILLCSNFIQAQTTPPKYETRAVWLTTIGGIDWPHSYAQSAESIKKQKKELTDILDRLQKANINTILLQTRVRGTVIYPSLYEPWDGCMSGHPGKSPGYDPLSFAISECHRRGMELHAWIVTIPVGKWDGAGCRNLRKTMPGNLMKINGYGYMRPESALTADYLSKICNEVTANYDIDGIHLDYIRYPEDMPKLNRLPKDEGRRNISRIVKRIAEGVKSLKPWVKMSCSPVGKYSDLSRYDSKGWNAYNAVCQDAQAWLRDGTMDMLFPMMYFRDNHFFPFALDWQEKSCGKPIVPGLGIYFLSPREKNWPLTDITRELSFLRRNNMGHAYFRSKFFTDDTKGIYSHACDAYCRYPALNPPMTWMGYRQPEAPCLLDIHNDSNTTHVSWTHNIADSCMVSFNIYSSRDYPVNTDDARNIIDIRRTARHISLPTSPGRHYAVTAMDRYGNESHAMQIRCAKGCELCNKPTHGAPTIGMCVAHDMLKCEGASLTLPNSINMTDARYLLIESAEGCCIATLPKPEDTETISLHGIDDGVYTLRTLGKKGVSHRLGMFVKKTK